MCTTPVLTYSRCDHAEPTGGVVQCSPAYQKGTRCAVLTEKKIPQPAMEMCSQCTIKSTSERLKVRTAQTLNRCETLGATEADIARTRATPEQMRRWQSRGYYEETGNRRERLGAREVDIIGRTRATEKQMGTLVPRDYYYEETRQADFGRTRETEEQMRTLVPRDFYYEERGRSRRRR